MVVISLILLLTTIFSTHCIYRKNIRHYNFIDTLKNKADQPKWNLQDIPIFKVCTKDRAPFTINVNKEDIIPLFLDHEDAINFMTELSQRNSSDINSPTMMCICISSLNDWFDKVDPNRQHIKGIKHKLVPSSNQVRHMYDYVKYVDSVKIPLYYSPSLRDGHDSSTLLMFLDFNDLISHIKTLKSAVERESAKRDIMIAPFLDFMLSKNILKEFKNVRLVPSSLNVRFCRDERYSSAAPSRMLK